jgi:hypothetical protein
MTRLLTQVAILFFFYTFASYSSASESEGVSLAKEIILLEATSYRVVTEFNVYAMQKDKQSEKRLFDVLATGDQLSDLFADQSNTLASSWSKYRNFAWAKHHQKSGDTYVFNDMRILHKELLTIILKVKKQVNGHFLATKDLYKVNGILLIEQLASEYLEISAATFGTFGFAGSEQAIKIEQRSEAFEQILVELNKVHSEDTIKLEAIKKLALRWRFIKNTLLAYNKRSAPFAVSKTVGYMRKQLAEL